MVNHLAKRGELRPGSELLDRRLHVIDDKIDFDASKITADHLKGLRALVQDHPPSGNA